MRFLNLVALYENLSSVSAFLRWHDPVRVFWARNHSGPSTALNLPSSLQSSLIRPARFSYSSACSFVMPRYVAACNASDCWWDNSESSSANCLASCADVVSSSVPIGTLPGSHNNGLSVFVRYSTYLRNPKYPSVRPRTNRCESTKPDVAPSAAINTTF